MSEADPLLVYAPGHLEHSAERLLRWIVCLSAMIHGGASLMMTGLHIALAKGWAATPNTMGWGLRGGLDAAVMVAQAAAMLALVVGGGMLLMRLRASILVLRASAIASILLTVLGLILAMQNSATYRSYWSTPAAACVQGLQLMNGMWLQAMMLLLTLPPLAKRMVG